MNEQAFPFQTHLDAIREILFRNQSSNRLATQLLGHYISLAEADFHFRHGHSPDRARRIMLSTLDSITALIAKIGENLAEDEFQLLLSHSSEIHLWASNAVSKEAL